MQPEVLRLICYFNLDVTTVHILEFSISRYWYEVEDTGDTQLLGKNVDTRDQCGMGGTRWHMVAPKWHLLK